MELHDPERPCIPGTSTRCYVDQKGSPVAAIPALYLDSNPDGTVRLSMMLKVSYNSYTWVEATVPETDLPEQMLHMRWDFEDWLEQVFGYKVPTDTMPPKIAPKTGGMAPPRVLSLEDLGL